MIVYHGTTRRRAMRIRAEGFLPKKPSRKVWFAKGHGYAHGRANTQARRAHDSAVVLTCDIDIASMRETYGSRKVFYRNGIIAIDAAIPPTVLRSSIVDLDQPQTPGEISSWVASVLQIRAHKGPGVKHPGVIRLSEWITRRKLHRPTTEISRRELLGKARQWLPEFFADYQVDPDSLQVSQTIEAPFQPEMTHGRTPLDFHDFDEGSVVDPREEQALDHLLSDNPRRRAKGLKALADIDSVDLYDWCTMYLDDEHEVVVAALRMMARAEPAEVEPILPLADSEDQEIRAAATAALTRHSGDDASVWFERGLKDPSPCVRMEVCGRLSEANPADERLRTAFELALYDPNPAIRQRAERLVQGKGYHLQTW